MDEPKERRRRTDRLMPGDLISVDKEREPCEVTAVAFTRLTKAGIGILVYAWR